MKVISDDRILPVLLCPIRKVSSVRHRRRYCARSFRIQLAHILLGRSLCKVVSLNYTTRFKMRTNLVKTFSKLVFPVWRIDQYLPPNIFQSVFGALPHAPSPNNTTLRSTVFDPTPQIGILSCESKAQRGYAATSTSISTESFVWTVVGCSRSGRSRRAISNGSRASDRSNSEE